MVVVPATNPATLPDASIVATTMSVEVQSPPGIVLLSAIVCPSHTVVAPAMLDGNGLTVISVALIQPVGNA
jgi:hypothetical protein